MADCTRAGDRGGTFRQSGSMTVFFCLALLLIGAIVCTCLESAKTAGLRFMAKTASDSALQSVFADYHEALWEDYHVFFHHEEKDITETLGQYLEYYENPAKGLYGITEYTDLWGLTVDQITVEKKKGALSDGGRLFLEQAVEYEKYQIAETLLEELLNRTGLLEEIDRIRSFAVALSGGFEQIQQISTLYQDVRDSIGATLQLADQIQNVFAGEAPDLSASYVLVRELADHVEHLKQTAERYLSEAETINDLAGELAAEYGDSRDTVYGQQISQLKAFTINGLLGAAVENVTRNADSVSGQLYSVMAELERMLTVEEDGEENGIDELTAVYERIFSAAKMGSQIMQELEGRMNAAEGFGESDAEDDEHIPGDPNMESDADQAQAGQSLLETVKQWKNMAVLALVMGSEAAQTKADQLGEPSQLPSAVVSDTLEGVTAMEKGLFIFYVTDTFTSVLSDRQNNYAYQQEYIAFGKKDSRSNLTAMAERLLVIREGLNLTFLLTNGQMRSLAETVAYAVVGGTGIYPLVLLTQFVILAAWAFAESVADVRALFNGDAVSIWKTERTWKTSISGWAKVPGEARALSAEDGAFDVKLTYSDYLRLFLLAEDTQTLCLRSMDIIQQEISSGQRGFRMMDCCGAADIVVQFSAPFRLITLPIVGERAGVGHRIDAVSSYKYK